MRYGDNLVIATMCGHKNVMCLTNRAQHVLNDKWCANRDTDVTKESRCIVDAAAKLKRAFVKLNMALTNSP